jgi:GABA(A) receptor-associated protein
MTSTSATDIVSIHKNKVPIIISEESTISMEKTKFIVPRAMTLGQFHCIIKKYTVLKSTQTIVLFVDSKLPAVSDTIGNLYDLHKDGDDFLYIVLRNENAFG